MIFLVLLGQPIVSLLIRLPQEDGLLTNLILLIFLIVLIIYPNVKVIEAIKVFYQAKLLIYDDRIENNEPRLLSSPEHDVYYFSDIDAINKPNLWGRSQYIKLLINGKEYGLFINCYAEQDKIYTILDTTWKNYSKKQQSQNKTK